MVLLNSYYILQVPFFWIPILLPGEAPQLKDALGGQMSFESKTGSLGVMLGLHWGYIWIMENRMEATIES